MGDSDSSGIRIETGLLVVDREHSSVGAHIERLIRIRINIPEVTIRTRIKIFADFGPRKAKIVEMVLQYRKIARGPLGDGERFPFQEHKHFVEELGNGIDKEGSIGIGFPSIISKKTGEIGERKSLPRPLEPTLDLCDLFHKIIKISIDAVLFIREGGDRVLEGAQGVLRLDFHFLDGALAKLDGALLLLNAFNTSSSVKLASNNIYYDVLYITKRYYDGRFGGEDKGGEEKERGM